MTKRDTARLQVSIDRELLDDLRRMSELRQTTLSQEIDAALRYWFYRATPRLSQPPWALVLYNNDPSQHELIDDLPAQP